VTAQAYAAKHCGQVLLVERDGTLEFGDYAEGWNADRPHALYSGTKSFWGVLAVAARDDGLLALDEPVADTIATWRAEARKRAVTLRMLLTLTSGFGFGGLGNAVPTFDAALEFDLRDVPGTTFTYGGIPLQVFGAVLTRKLAARKLSPQAYLHERLLDPLGLRVANWRALKDGSEPLPTGAFLAPAEWLKYGRFLLAGGRHGKAQLVRSESLAECFAGSAVNERYGLGFWLAPADDAVYASGAGGQGLYVLRTQRLVAVRFGDGRSYRHEAFLRALRERSR
jgi:CubicO group peptidase (beta-lactamase class C family)